MSGDSIPRARFFGYLSVITTFSRPKEPDLNPSFDVGWRVGFVKKFQGLTGRLMAELQCWDSSFGQQGPSVLRMMVLTPSIFPRETHNEKNTSYLVQFGRVHLLTGLVALQLVSLISGVILILLHFVLQQCTLAYGVTSLIGSQGTLFKPKWLPCIATMDHSFLMFIMSLNV